MTIDEREVLTKQIVSKKLIYESKRSMVGALLICILDAIFFGMFKLTILNHPYVTDVTRLTANLLQIPICGVCVFLFIRAIVNISKVKRGAFTVAKDVLADIKDHQFSLKQLVLYGGRDILLGSKAHLRHVFKFESGKVFIANAEEYKNTRLATAAEFSLPGDIFFLVFYNDSPNKIILLFSAKTHNYKDDK